MDRRDYMHEFGKLLPPGTKLDPKRRIIIFTTEDDEENETEHTLPTKFEVCPTCKGSGTHVNPAIDAHGITRDEFDDDSDFEEDYLNGRYDVTCHECKGKNVVQVVDPSKADKKTLKLFNGMCRDEADFRQICIAERRAEGWEGY